LYFEWLTKVLPEPGTFDIYANPLFPGNIC
jgi:hypothetical protein